MEVLKKLVISLLIAIIAGSLIYFISSYSTHEIDSTIDDLIYNKFSFSNHILLLNISFLRARRAEKNLIIFKSEQYKEELEYYLQEADGCILKMESIGVGSHAKSSTESLKNNIDAYRRETEKLAIVLLSDSPKEEDLTIINNDIKNLNKTIADEITYLSTEIQSDISSTRSKLTRYVSNLKMLPVQVLIIAVLGLYAAIFYEEIFAWLLRSIR